MWLLVSMIERSLSSAEISRSGVARSRFSHSTLTRPLAIVDVVCKLTGVVIVRDADRSEVVRRSRASQVDLTLAC
jgi:hypothetical protein